MIELRKISAGYRGEPVLRDVDLVFPAGCVTVLLGPNGCGKSTLLKTALGLLPALSGEVLYDGAPLSGMPPEQVARRAAYMAQSRNVPSIEARRMVLHGRFPYLSFPRRYRKSDYAAVRRAMEKADALELADRPMQELSGGQRQRVYLAMALAAAQLGNVTIQPDIGQPQGASHFLHFGVYHIKIMHGEHVLYGSQLFHIHVQFFRGGLSHFLTDFIHMSFHFKKEGKGGSQCFTD